jgi:membrane protein YqaA with SNARE-associated domain
LKFQDKKWFPFSNTQIDRSSRWFKKYGKWSLLFAWVPIIGDPITFIAGTMRIKFLIFLLLVSFGKIMRYFFISLLV